MSSIESEPRNNSDQTVQTPKRDLLNTRKWDVGIFNQILENFPKEEEYNFSAGFSPSGELHLGTFKEIGIIAYMSFIFTNKLSKKVRLRCFIDDLDSVLKIPKCWKHVLKEEDLGINMYALAKKYPQIMKTNVENLDLLKQVFPEVEYIEAHSDYKENTKIILPYLEKTLQNCSKIRQFLKDKMRTAQSYLPIYPIDQEDRVITRGRYKQHHLILNEHTYPLWNDKGDILCKMQWRVEWAVRWDRYRVHFEPSGKDHRDSWPQSEWIYKNVLEGKTAPVGFIYEYITVHGSKMSKSKGNFLSVRDTINALPQWMLKHWLLMKPSSVLELDIHKMWRHLDKMIGEVAGYKLLSKVEKVFNPLQYVFNKRVPHFLDPKYTFLKLMRFISCINLPKEVTSADFYTYIKERDIFIERESLPNNKFFEEMITKMFSYYKSFVISTAVETPLAHEYIRKIQGFIQLLKVNVQNNKLSDYLMRNKGNQWFYPIVTYAVSGPSFTWLLESNLRSRLIRILENAAATERYYLIPWEKWSE